MVKWSRDKSNFIGRPIPGHEKYKICEYVAQGGTAWLYRAYNQEVDHSFAVKLIPYETNNNPSVDWREEPRKANMLESQCVVHCSDAFDWTEEQCHVIVYEYIEGKSLKELIKENSKEISVGFICNFLETILALLYELSNRKLSHGDLHSGNIIVSKPSEYTLNAHPQFKVTDFGIGKLTGISQALDDYDGLAQMVSSLLECVNYQLISPKEKFIFNELNDCYASKILLEKDATLDPLARNPKEIINKLKNIENQYQQKINSTVKMKLITPFDYLSCEQIGSADSILKSLYSDKFLGLSEIESASNLILTGPRGCGKSTTFKSLSLKHEIRANKKIDSNKAYIGVYYHCNDLYYKFPRYKIPENEKLFDYPIHYITCRLLIEFIDAIRLHIDECENGINESAISRKIWDELAIEKPGIPSVYTFNAITTKLRQECQSVVERSMYSRHDGENCHIFRPDILSKICEIVINDQSFTIKRIYFFIDDYSAPHITKDLQKNLNRIFMQRSPHCFFKISTESPVSFVNSDLDGKHYVEGREYEILNLGFVFISAPAEKKAEFIEDVFAKRFKAVKEFPAKTINELLGSDSLDSQTEIAQKIKNKEKIIWSGGAVIPHLCSGDIHSMISLVKLMVELNGNKPTKPLVTKDIQNRAIRNYAGKFLENLKNTGKNGERLTEIVSAFGKVAHSHLVYRKSKNQGQDPQWQASRIELHSFPGLDDEANNIYEELLRYSVFIVDTRGKSIRGNIVPRLYLRRFLIPHFNLTFSMRDSIKMSAEMFTTLIKEPERYENIQVLKSEKIVDDEPSESAQQNLGF